MRNDGNNLDIRHLILSRSLEAWHFAINWDCMVLIFLLYNISNISFVIMYSIHSLPDHKDAKFMRFLLVFTIHIWYKIDAN